MAHYEKTIRDGIGAQSSIGEKTFQYSSPKYERELLTLISNIATIPKQLDKVREMYDEGKRGKAMMQLGQLKTHYEQVFRHLLAENSEFHSYCKERFEHLQEEVENGENRSH